MSVKDQMSVGIASVAALVQCVEVKVEGGKPRGRVRILSVPKDGEQGAGGGEGGKRKLKDAGADAGGVEGGKRKRAVRCPTLLAISLSLSLSTIYIYIYMCMYVCIYIYLYIHIYVYFTHIDMYT